MIYLHKFIGFINKKIAQFLVWKNGEWRIYQWGDRYYPYFKKRGFTYWLYKNEKDTYWSRYKDNYSTFSKAQEAIKKHITEPNFSKKAFD